MKQLLELNSLALELRRKFNEDSYSPIDVFSLVNSLKSKNITLVKYPMKDRISGMCVKNNDIIVIAINSEMSYGRQRFSLAHELYHVFYDNINENIICQTISDNERPDNEKEADIFASYLLMPYDALYQYVLEHKINDLNDIIDLEQLYQISHSAMLYRLKNDNIISSEQYKEYSNVSIITEAILRGYDSSLYVRSADDKLYLTLGEYVRKVNKLYNMHKITNGKKEELLMDGFRADIVYNLYEGVDDANV